MKGTKNFIIELDTIYHETFKTKGGVEIYGNTSFTEERQSNRIAKVIGIPSLYQTEIKEGYEVLIDASPLYRQIYRGTKQWYQNVVDDERNWFHLEKDMIVCYREDTNSEWKGFLKNTLVKPIMEEEKKLNSSTLIEVDAPKKFTGKVEMFFSNKELNRLGVRNGDTLYMDLRGGVQYWFEGIEYWWVRNKDIFAISI